MVGESISAGEQEGNKEDISAKQQESGETVPFDPDKARREQNLGKFVDFMKNDLAVKKIMAELAPSEEIDHDADAAVQYEDDLAEGVDDAKWHLGAMIDDFFPDGAPLKKRLEGIQRDVAATGCDANKMRQVYQNDIAAMDPEFVKQVTQNVAGFMTHAKESASHLAGQAHSMNEILHLVHSYASRSEKILADLPILKQDAARHNQLCGDEQAQNEVAAQVYDNLNAQDSQLQFTTVVALKNRTLAMIRDYGHATMLDVTKAKDGYEVNYHLARPKNVRMTNQLPGVHKVTEPFKATSGQFFIETQDDGEAVEALTKFIFSIPTDADIDRSPAPEADIDQNPASEAVTSAVAETFSVTGAAAEGSAANARNVPEVEERAAEQADQSKVGQRDSVDDTAQSQSDADKNPAESQVDAQVDAQTDAARNKKTSFWRRLFRGGGARNRG